MSRVFPELRLLPIGAAMHTVVAALHQRCFGEGWTSYTVGQVMRMAGAFGYLAVLGADSEGGDDSEPVGFALVSGTLDEWELLSIAVLPDHRRRGIAKRLLQAVIDGARARGAAKLFLEVAEDNDAARRLYEAYGFAPIGRRPGYYKRRGGAAAAITMRRDVPG